MWTKDKRKDGTKMLLNVQTNKMEKKEIKSVGHVKKKLCKFNFIKASKIKFRIFSAAFYRAPSVEL